MFQYAPFDIVSDLSQLPAPLRVWLLWLLIVDFVLLLPFLGHREVRVVAMWQLANAVCGLSLYSIVGLVRLLSLSHVLFWTPMTVYLYRKLPLIPANRPFGIWARVFVATNLISLIVDYTEVIRYVLGERGSLV